MARILKGKEVADALTAQMRQDVEDLKAAGVTPTLCIFRVGERPDDLSYERGAAKRAGAVGIEVKKVVLPADVSQETFDREFEKVNRNDSIHGILLFRPIRPRISTAARTCRWQAFLRTRRPAFHPAPRRRPWRSCITTAFRSRGKKPPSSAAHWSSDAPSP